MENFTDVSILDIGYVSRVYKVVDTRDNKVKALKCYSQTWNKDHFENEEKICKQLDHENCVRLLDSFTSDMGSMLVLEFCEGGNLRQVFSKHREQNMLIEANTRRRWLRELICGIDYLHRNGIIHRDIHPRNILLKEDKIKIGDFRLVQKEVIEGNTRLGSLKYLSPEVVAMLFLNNENKKEQFHNKGADIWSFGCIMFEMFTNQKVIAAKSDLQILTLITDAHFVPPQLNSGDAVLDQLFQTMLSIISTERPTSSYVMSIL